METEITKKEENKMLGRKEVSATVSFTGPTPKRKEIKDSVCGKIGANPDLVALREIKNEYGTRKVGVKAHVYESKEQMSKVEPEHIRKKEESSAEKPAETEGGEPTEAQDKEKKEGEQ